MELFSLLTLLSVGDRGILRKILQEGESQQGSIFGEDSIFSS